MQYIKIKNDGMIDPMALTLLGASTKVGDSSKIGQFGSGNKYAIAYFLREKIGLRIFADEDEIKVEVFEKIFRNKMFGVIHINGEPTSITTDMGKDWKLWQAVREIYCNAIDEGGGSFEIVDIINPKSDETHFYLEINSHIEAFLGDFDNYFSNKKEVLFECEHGQILRKSGKAVNIYRKGIRCSDYETHSIFDYNLNTIHIGENRLIKFPWDPEEKIWKLIFSCTNKEVLEGLFHGLDGEDVYEARFSGVTELDASYMSKECVEVLTSLKLVPDDFRGLLKPEERKSHLVIPNKVFKKIRTKLKNENVGEAFKVYKEGMYRELEETEGQLIVINNALNFLQDSGFYIPYVVKVGAFANKGVQGCAHGEVIVLSEVNLEKGTTEVINTIIEEYIHIKYGVEDETRGFQTAIITEFISYLKQNKQQKEQ